MTSRAIYLFLFFDPRRAEVLVEAAGPRSLGRLGRTLGGSELQSAS